MLPDVGDALGERVTQRGGEQRVQADRLLGWPFQRAQVRGEFQAQRRGVRDSRLDDLTQRAAGSAVLASAAAPPWRLVLVPVRMARSRAQAARISAGATPRP